MYNEKIMRAWKSRLFIGLPARGAVSWVLALLLLALVFGVFAPTARNGFINYDDNVYIYENPHVLRGLTRDTALWALTSMEQANWYPLRRLSHLVDVSLFGLDARWHHLMSVAWHAAAAVMLFLALRLMTGCVWRSFLVTGLFAVHPLQVESVAWAAERSNVQAGFFFALTLLLWVRYARRPGPGRYGAALVCCALGLVAKPVLVPLPFLLLLIDFWPLGRMSAPGSPPWRATAPLLWRRLLEKIPQILLAAGVAAIAVVAHRHTESLSTLETLPLGARLANAAISYWRYLGKLLLPVDLAVFYPHPALGIPAGRAMLAGLLLAALTALALLLVRRRPWLAAGWLWYLGMLVPMIGVVQFGRQALADRFAYIPSIGVFLALVWDASERSSRWRYSRVFLAGCAAFVLAALSAVTFAQTKLWRDSLTLFGHTRAVSGSDWIIEDKIGLALLRLRRAEEAVAHFREAVRLQPGLKQTHNNLGNALHALQLRGEAEAQYREAVRLDPDYAEAHYNLGIVLYDLGRYGEAELQYREAVRLDPESARAHNNLGIVLHDLKRYGEAEAQYRETLRLAPDFSDAYYNLGNTLSVLLRYGEAAEFYREALRLQPGDADTHSNLGFALWRLGRIEAAAAQYGEVLRLRPGDAQARRNLDMLLSAPGFRQR